MSTWCWGSSRTRASLPAWLSTPSNARPEDKMHADTEPQRPAEPVRELHSRRVHECPLGDFSVESSRWRGGQLCLHVLKQGVPPHGASVGGLPHGQSEASPIHRLDCV